ncbi:hypothetical protein [Thiolapillus sp.]|uniref:hypothetical protein n=2 Tax=Thiolapillus sp. TaxID=2017437 RepID=UPI0025F33C2F|nr:hypothetical protein [Thiolapillus sp.]
MMEKKVSWLLAASVGLLLLNPAVGAQGMAKEKMKKLMAVKRELPVPPPAGLFGAYAFPSKGQGMAGISYAHFSFEGLRMDTDSVSTNTVVSTVANRFFGLPGMPPTLRVVPIKVDVDVAYPFANFAIGHDLALIGVAPVIRKEITFRTYGGSVGTTVLGDTTQTVQGLGDVKGGLLYRAHNDPIHHTLLIGVLSLPTGSITKRGNLLTPAGTTQNVRMPYGAQLGTGTIDAIVGGVYWGKKRNIGWGAQYYATVPLENKNADGYRWGTKHEATAWASYLFMPQRVGVSARIRGESQDSIHGMDPNIIGPGLGANPDNYGGDKVELSLGVNWSFMPGQNISVELAKPVYQDRNGVQPDHDFSLFASWRVGFF